MSISFSAIKTHKDLTLGSVECGLGTLNICRDPPKSIHTRRINKVGQNSDITQMIDAGDDRANEAIKVYARGVNPMVSVSYSNASNNGGQSAMARSGQAMASLPYKVAVDGAFRPPMIPPTELLPLSRQPRLTTQAITNPQAINYTQKVMCPAPETMKQIRKIKLEKTEIKPTARYFIEKSGINTLNTDNYVLNNPISVSGFSGLNTQKHHNIKSRAAASNNIKDAHYNVVLTNPGAYDKIKKIETVLDTDRYLQDVTKKSMQINPGKRIDKNNYVQDKIELSRNVPKHSYEINPSRGDQGDFYKVNGRTVKLQEKRRPQGTIETYGTVPQTQRTVPQVKFNQTAYNKRKQIQNMINSRN